MSINLGPGITVRIKVEGAGLPSGGEDGKILGHENGKPQWVEGFKFAVNSVNGKTGDVQLTAGDVEADPAGSAAAAEKAAKEYADQQIAAIPTPDVSGQIEEHNQDALAHPAIRQMVTELGARLNALADSDDATLDQLSEIVAYIKSNKSLIDAVTTSKVSVSDIVDGLTSGAADKPLSARQGAILKAMIEAITVPTALSQLTGDAAHRTVTDAEKAAWDAKSEFSGVYGDLTGKPTIPTVPQNVGAFENDTGYVTEEELNAKGYLTEHQDISHKLDANKLPKAVEDALAQAKASGEFDGAPGDDGITPHIGSNGNWYLDETDTGKPSRGAAGESGQDGISPTVSVSKSGKVTTISITDVNGTKTATIDDGSDGAPGRPGTDGATPVRGVDYWTEADQEAITEEVSNQLSLEIADELAKRDQLKPEFANSIEECTDTSKLYVLPDGFIYAYIAGEESKPMYTNQLPISTDTDGSVYNVTGYNVGYRLNSSSNVVALGTAGATNPAFVTGFIPVTSGQTVRLKNCYIDTDGIDGAPSSAETKSYYGEACGSVNLLLCNSGKETMNVVSWVNAAASEYFDMTPDSDGIVTEFTVNRSGLSYIRLVLAGDAPNAIITVDEEIANSDGSQAGWRNTGRAFVPADYEDRIVALEKSLTRGEVAVYGAVDENGDVILCGPLDAGTHTFKYMQANGATAIIGTLTVAEG